MSSAPTESQFPAGRRRIRGSYDSLAPSARGQWNARDTASVGAFVVAVQPVLMPMSYLLDDVASSMMPKVVPEALGTDLGGWALLLTQTLVCGLIKGASNLLRHQGSSLLKDLLAWLSIVLGDLIRASFISAAFDWLPWRRRRRRRDRDVLPDGVPWPRPRPPKPRPRRRLLPWRRRRLR